jgi:hypothetical protein
MERDRNAIIEGRGRIVSDLLDEGQGALNVLDGIERNLFMRTPTAFLLMALFLKGGIFLLDPGGIHKDDRQQVGRGGGCQDRALKSLADEPGDKAAVVEVGMGQKQEVYFIRRDWKGIPVPSEEGTFLKEAAIHENIQSLDLQGVAGPCHLLGRAEEPEFHQGRNIL